MQERSHGAVDFPKVDKDGVMGTQQSMSRAVTSRDGGNNGRSRLTWTDPERRLPGRYDRLRYAFRLLMMLNSSAYFRYVFASRGSIYREGNVTSYSHCIGCLES